MFKKLPQYGAAFLVATLLTLFASHFGALDKIEYIAYDWRVRILSSNKPARDDVVVVAVDQFSLEWMEKEQGIGWPWPREIYGAINSFAGASGAKAVVYDMIFSEDSVYNQSDDDAFAESLKRLPTVGVIVLGNANYGQAALPQNISFPNAYDCSDSEVHTKAVFPTQGLAAAFSQLGVANALPDNDGVIRRVKLCHNLNGVMIPSLALAAYNAVYPNRAKSFKTEAFINYSKEPFSYETYNAAALVQSWSALQNGEEPTIAPELLKDKVIFIGLSASGLFDQKASPLSKNHPGVDIQARIFDNLAGDSFIEKIPFAQELLYTLFFGALSAWLMMRARRVVDFLIPLVAIPAFIFALGYLYYFYDFYLRLAPLLVVTFLVLIFTGILGYLLEGRQKRYIKTAFSRYVNPAIVEKLVEFPEQLKLGGEKRELSIFFSDIEGFTSVSERLEPERLIEMLHEYLENLSTIIMDNEGTIDKYEGDAIIAFWNAPLDTKEHETLAVKTALACQKKISELNPGFLKKYGVELKTRIGINTGTVIVGNLGSAKHFDYSFIGDAGNLASRIEGVNKIFGTDILVTKTTQERVKGVKFRKIGTVKVVGRAEAVEVYQPLNAEFEGKHDELFAQAVELFETAKFEESKKIFEAMVEFERVALYYLQIIKDIENKDLIWKNAIVLSSK